MGQVNVNNLVGQTFNRWTVIAYVEHRNGHPYYQVQCSCGSKNIVDGCNLKNGGTKSCGCLKREIASARRGNLNPLWKGGRRKNKNGYIDVLVSPGSDRYVPEHRMIMEQHLGRPLFPDETVHHRNGLRDDNRLENLELKASSHGKGQTIPDLIAWAKEILTRYEQQPTNV